MLTASTRTVRMLTRDAASRGIDTDALLDEVGLTAAELENPEGRVPEQSLRMLLLLLLERIDDPAWGLQLSADLEPGTFGTMGYVFRNAETLADSYQRVVRYAQLLNQAAQPSLELGPEHGRFTLHMADPAPPPRALVRMRAQSWLSVLVRVGRKITGTQFQPTRVSFPFPTPADLAPYRPVFDCELIFDAPHAVLELSAAAMALPVVAPDRDLASIMERYAEGLLERLPDSGDIDLRVRQATCRAVEGGDPRLERVARELAMSPRSLQRKLQATDISFSEVLDEVRRELAEAYLHEPDLSVDQVASVLGFASGSSFAKAFRRWTGMAPASYRERPINT